MSFESTTAAFSTRSDSCAAITNNELRALSRLLARQASELQRALDDSEAGGSALLREAETLRDGLRAQQVPLLPWRDSGACGVLYRDGRREMAAPPC